MCDVVEEVVQSVWKLSNQCKNSFKEFVSTIHDIDFAAYMF